MPAKTLRVCGRRVWPAADQLMPDFRTNRRVTHSAEEMFALVADVERYPEFVPFCERLDVRGRRSEGETEVLVVDMTVGYKLIRESFSCKVTLDRPALEVRADYLDGPFRALENSWSFEPLPAGGCIISFCIQYEFKSRALAALMGAMFDRAFRTFASAFEKRADQLYGKAGASAA
jgi:coenzyme Q-binding protein COQ10